MVAPATIAPIRDNRRTRPPGNWQLATGNWQLATGTQFECHPSLLLNSRAPQAGTSTMSAVSALGFPSPMPAAILSCYLTVSHKEC